jgi:hypothetical protein
LFWTFTFTFGKFFPVLQKSSKGIFGRGLRGDQDAFRDKVMEQRRVYHLVARAAADQDWMQNTAPRRPENFPGDSAARRSLLAVEDAHLIHS